MKKILGIITLLLVSSTALSAQDYNGAVGIRGGVDLGGITGKYKFDAVNSIELMLSVPWDNGFIGTALWERHIPVIGNGFNFYYGAGAHIGGWKKKFELGADVIAGLEFVVPGAPVAFSFDYKPSLAIVERFKFRFADFGFGMKFVF